MLPELNGKLHGFAIRAPVPTGSVVDLTFEADRETLGRGAQRRVPRRRRRRHEGHPRSTPRTRSSRRDIVSNPHSSIVDGLLTAVIDGTLVKVVSWYDNEWGYSNRVVELAQKVLPS